MIEKKIKKRKKEENVGYLLVMPAMLLIVCFFAVTFVSNLITSFTDEKTIQFVGFQNYIKVLKDPAFFIAVKNTVIWTVCVTISQFLIGFFLALLCSHKVKGISFLRPIFTFPWAIPSIVATLAWKWIYNTDFGVLNLLLRNLGIIQENISWLTVPRTAMLAAIIVSAWKGSPYYLMMLYAGLEGVPTDLYEAAEIDGANRRQRFIHITIPQIVPIISMSLTLGTIWTLNAYENLFALTGGGPSRKTETLPLYIYNTAFTYFRMHDAVVPSIVLFMCVIVLAGVYLLVKKKGGQTDEL